MSKEIDKSKSSGNCIGRKTSVEDLAKEGYTIGQTLGEGSFCKVKAASFQGKEMAVKIITKERLSESFATKFLPRELNILTKVKHPNIVHVYRIYKYPKRIYIFMELVHRGNLAACIGNFGRRTEFQTYHYFKQIISGVKYIHSLNFAHRDLKCENIMINDNDEIKIIDFGFSRLAMNENGRKVLCRTYCGSQAYASPEILQGIPYNPMMSDVWSLGCVLYIMIIGSFPFDDSNLKDMVLCQLMKKIKYPETFTVAEPIKCLISLMLEPDITKRANMNQVSRFDWLTGPPPPNPSELCITETYIDIYSKCRTTSTQTQAYVEKSRFKSSSGHCAIPVIVK